MELLFETRLEVTRVEGRMDLVRPAAVVDAEPVFRPDRPSDGNRVLARTVLRDSGRLRMWYQAFPRVGEDHVAYAESDDGLTWRKPDLRILPGVNNYTNLGLCSPSVCVDPDAPPERRYAAVGYLRAGKPGADPAGTSSGFYTSYSADGFHWTLDTAKPRWQSGDVITNIHDPAHGRVLCAMKFVRRVNGIARRAIWTAERRGGEWSEPACALAPDEFDDVAAVARGFNSTDYYGMALRPAGKGMAGFLWNFRHKLPLSNAPENYAIFGSSDITLVYQAKPGDRWLHAAGRRSFIAAGDRPWNAGWTQSVSAPVDMGGEEWLFLNGDPFSHAWHMGADWKPVERWSTLREASGAHTVAGAARWRRGRLFGYQANPEGLVEIELGEIARPCELRLNYAAGSGGGLRAQVFSRSGRGDLGEIVGRSGESDAAPMQGDSVCEAVRWRDGGALFPAPGRRLVLVARLINAALYGWELKETND